jgi:hypothetical protein
MKDITRESVRKRDCCRKTWGWKIQDEKRLEFWNLFDEASEKFEGMMFTPAAFFPDHALRGLLGPFHIFWTAGTGNQTCSPIMLKSINGLAIVYSV